MPPAVPRVALAMSSAHSPPEGELEMESVAVLKEADKYALHTLLWEHIDEMISTAATTRALTADHPVTKGPLVQLSGVLHRLGSPSEQQRRTARRNTIVNNRLEEYLIRTSQNISKQALHEIRAKDIFYYVRWCSVVWCGMWCGVVYCGVVCGVLYACVCSVVWCGVCGVCVWCDVVCVWCVV